MSVPRGQSNVVGVSVLLGLTVLSLGALTAGVGVVVEEHAASADARHVAADLDAALRPVETTGAHRGDVAFTHGSLATVERDLRVLADGRVVRRVRVGGLVYTGGDRRVAYVAGAVVRGSLDGPTLSSAPPVTAGPDVLIVGAPRLGGSVAAAGENVRVTLRTDVSHDRTRLGSAPYRLAIETRTPGPLVRHLGTDRPTTVRDLDGDGVPSAIVGFPGERTGYLVVHDLGLEAGHG